MHHLAFRYTQYINRKYKRIGHLFQGRFKSVLVDDEKYLNELIRYIHLNPVRAGMTSLPRDYFWSSHKAYLGQNDFVWLSKDRVLTRFHFERESALMNFEKYVLNGIGVDSKYDFKSGFVNGVVGDQEFVDESLSFACVKQKRKVDVNDLIGKICEVNNLTKEELSSSTKLAKFSKARAMLALLVRESENISLEELGRILRRDASGLTKLANRLEMKILKDSMELHEVEKMLHWILLDSKRMSECQA